MRCWPATAKGKNDRPTFNPAATEPLVDLEIEAANQTNEPETGELDVIFEILKQTRAI
jgi:hypothetical protein